VVEPNHSTIGFAIPIAGITRVTGKFQDFGINIDYRENDITKSLVEVKIKVASINTGIEGRDNDLQSETFFYSEKYPEITFKSSSITKVDDHYVAKGEFTMRGVNKEISIPFEQVSFDGNTLAFRIRIKINRMDYGVGTEWKHTLIPDFLGKDVDVEIDFWTKKSKIQ
jgi:polyisoprenoid-binding protein YceI